MTISLSVVVPTRDRPAMLRRCLASIRAGLRDGDELIVVDNGSTDDAASPVAAELGAQRIATTLPGAARARNLGWRAANNDIVAFIDDDITVEPGWADAIRETFTARPGLTFVSGMVVPPPEQEGAAHPIAIDAPEPMDHVLHAAHYEGGSGNFAARREALERIGGFDESLGAGVPLRGAEDLDLFDRLLASGATGRYEPSVLTYHDQWRTKRQRLKVDFSYGIGTGARLAKLTRTDRAHARVIAKEIFWRWGLKDFFTCLRKGYEYGALAALLRLAGMVRGVVVGFAIPVVDGHFAPRRRHSAADR